MLFAQGNPIFEPNPVVSQNGLSITTIDTYKKPTNKKLLTAYLNEDWQTGNIHLFTKEVVKGYPVKYDFGSDLAEIKDTKNDTVVYVPGHQIREFEVYSPQEKKVHVYINEFKYTKKAYPPVFYELLAAGKMELLKKIKVVLIKANYNSTLDVGSKTDTKSLRFELFVYNGKEMIKLIKSKKKILALLEDKKEQINQYIKDEKISVKKEEDLIKLFTYYNSLK